MRYLLIIFTTLLLTQNTFGQISWTTSASGIESGFIVKCFTVLQNKMYAVGAKGNVAKIYESSNNGSTWTAMTTTGLENFSYDYLAICTVGNALLLSGRDGVDNPSVFKSTDNGSSWNTANSGFAPGYAVEYFAVTASGVVLTTGGASANIYQSSDNGDSWTLLTTTGLPATTYTSISAKGNDLYIAASGLSQSFNTIYTIYKSIDNGSSWSLSNSGIPVDFFTTCIASSSSGMYAGGYKSGTTSASQLFTSIDDGASWTEVTMSGLGTYNYSLNTMCAIGNDMLMDASDMSFTHMVFRSTITTGVKDSEAIAVTTFPNPAKDVIRISMDDKSQEYTVQVCDLTGTIILQFTNTDLIDISDLTSGTYLLKIMEHNRIGVTRIVKM